MQQHTISFINRTSAVVIYKQIKSRVGCADGLSVWCGVVWWQALGRRTRRWQQWRSCLRATLHNHNHMSRSGSGVGLINGQMQNPILHAAMVMAML
jgi:hypothetical protein